MKWSREPDWTSENQNRRKGDTTFTICGWCEHISGGTCRYDCHLSGRCDLLPNYHFLNEVKWDTPCVLNKLGLADIKSFIESKRDHIHSLEAQIKDIRSEIDVLASLELDDRPFLPQNRNWDHFNIGDRIWCFVRSEDCYTRKGWISGTVCEGYRHHDGCVSFIADQPYHTNLDYHEGKGGGGEIAVPTVILDSEYQWFKDRPDRFKDWIELSCSKKFNGETIDPEEIEVSR